MSADVKVQEEVEVAISEPQRLWSHTLALTLSNDGGLTIEKHIRKTSVCG